MAIKNTLPLAKATDRDTGGGMRLGLLDSQNKTNQNYLSSFRVIDSLLRILHWKCEICDCIVEHKIKPCPRKAN